MSDRDGAAFLIDVSRLIWRQWVGRLPTGIDRVCLAYLRRYRHGALAVVQRNGFRRILGRTESNRLFAALLAEQPSRFRIAVALARGLLSRPRVRPGLTYFNVGHTGLQEAGLVKWVDQVGVKPIYMVHDLIPMTHPQYCRPGETDRHGQRIDNMLTTAVGIVGNSQATINVLDEYRRGRGLPPVPMIAAPLGVDVVPVGASQADTTDHPTFVTVGTIEARKNHLLLLQIWAELVDRLGSGAPRLLVIGQRGWENDEALKLLDSEALKGAVIEIGRCRDDEMAAHLSTARAMLFPSLVEGYGLPLVEALGAGTPVIASDLPVFREIGQGVPDFLDPSDAKGWTDAILDYAWQDNSGRQAQMKRLAGFVMPTWAEHFAMIDRWRQSL